MVASMSLTRQVGGVQRVQSVTVERGERFHIVGSML